MNHRTIGPDSTSSVHWQQGKWAFSLVFLVIGGLELSSLLGCGTDQPFSRGEVPPTPTPTATPVPTPTATPGSTPTATATPGTEVTPTPGPPTPVPVSFAGDVKDLLMTCTGCHANGQGASAWQYDGGVNAYSQAMLKVNVADPPSSKILTKASGAESHQGGTFYPTSSSGYKTILAWIEAGASDN